MYISDRRSALRSATTISIIGLLYIYFLPFDTWHVTDDGRTALPNLPLQTSSPTTSTETWTGIPRKIWYKVGPRGVTPKLQEWIDTCLNNNPSYKSEFMTDISGDEYVENKFSHRPDIVEAFLSLQVPILKADMLRYLLLLNEGGIYSDLDVSCNVPIQDWIPEQYKQNASLVVGWEFDIGWGDNFVREFATWTIMAKPGSPHLQRVVDDIVEGLREKARELNVTIAELKWGTFGDVVDLTGPRRMTRGIMKSLKAKLGDAFEEKDYYAIPEPKLVEDVLILPAYAFALNSNKYQPDETQAPALVTHHFQSSWKNDHGGETLDIVAS